MPDDSCKLLEFVTTTAVDEAAVEAVGPAELLESVPAHVTPTRSVDQYNISSFRRVTIKDERDDSLNTHMQNNTESYVSNFDLKLSQRLRLTSRSPSATRIKNYLRDTLVLVQENLH